MVVKSSTESSKPRGENEKKHRQKALLVAQEISFAKVLAGNDKKMRDRGVKRLRKFLSARSTCDSDLKEDDFLRIWKGLYYCMWMSDKMLVQEELAETISSLVHCFQLPAPAIKFIKGFFKTMAQEWRGIDQHRYEKFLMFVRRFLRQSLFFVARTGWNLQTVGELCAVFQETLLPDEIQIKANSQAPLGLVMHFTDVFLEEFAKVCNGNINNAILLSFLKPFAHHLAASRDGRIQNHIKKHIFVHLLEQSPVGLEFQEKFEAWSKLGFPGGTIDAMQRVGDSGCEGGDDVEGGGDSEDDEVITNALDSHRPLDPRAGRVDVELPVINIDALSISKLLGEFRFKKFTNAKTRRMLDDLIKKFEKVHEGEFPLGLHEIPEIPSYNLDELAEEAAEDLMKYEERLKQDPESEEDDEMDESLKSGEESKKYKQRRRLSESSESNLDDGDEDGQQPKKLKKGTKKQKLKSSKKKVGISKEDSPSGKISKEKVLKKNAEEKRKNQIKPAATTTSIEDAHEMSNDVVSKSSISNGMESKESNVVCISKSPIMKGMKLKGKRRSLQTENEKFHVEEFPECSATLPSAEQTSSNLTSVHIKSSTVVPHITKSRNLKRRASLPAAFVVEDIDSNNSDNGDSGKRMKRRMSLMEEPLPEGEYEICIPSRKLIISEANKALMTPSPSKVKGKNSFLTPTLGKKLSTPGSSSKKVNFVLQRNTAQATSDYFRTLRENPAIPFDACKEPPRGVLKPSPYNSPINPFYKRKLKI